MAQADPFAPLQELSTIETAQLLGMSVRSVQLMADRGELQAWKTPGGHRRISAASVEQWRATSGRRAARMMEPANEMGGSGGSGRESASASTPSVLLIDDSMHFQKLVSLLVRQHFPHVTLHVADDGIGGLALYGRVQPQVLLVDIVLPGIDAVALLTSLRSHPQFARSHLGVVTSLDATRLTPYAFALEHVPVIYKPRLVTELPQVLSKWLAPSAEIAAVTPSALNRSPDDQASGDVLGVPHPATRRRRARPAASQT